jgi:uncharacterized protein (TIGR00255 family)
VTQADSKVPSGRPAYSMTGYATAQSTTADGLTFTLTLKSVNHRFLDLNLRLPSDCEAVELLLRRLLKENLKRGHVDVTLYVERRAKEQAQNVQVNHELLGGLIKAVHEAAKAHHFNVEPDLHALLKVPGVLSTDAPSSQDTSRAAGLEAAIAALAPSLLEQLNQVRGTEGAVLVAELRASMVRLRGLAEQCAEIRAGAREVHFQRLRSRVTELLRAAQEARRESAEPELQMSDQRLLAEAAILVERSDIEEELVRLRAHIESFLQMLDSGGELGKRLDFLLQELNREANTLLSKTSGGDPALGLRLTALGLEMKSEIERAREQVQNLE